MGIRYGYKTYWRLPFGWGEIQYGHLSRTWAVWLRRPGGGHRRVWPPHRKAMARGVDPRYYR